MSLWEVGTGEEGYGFYEIRIQDTGIGMSKDFVGKIFTAFERERSSTNSRTEGTGLGLAITKSIVDMMGGTIEVLTSSGTVPKSLSGSSSSSPPKKTCSSSVATNPKNPTKAPPAKFPLQASARFW